MEEYVRLASFDPVVEQARHADLMAFSRELHEFMYANARLTEAQKPLLVGGTLIALKNKAFAKTFGDYTPAELQREWFAAIKKEIQKANIPAGEKGQHGAAIFGHRRASRTRQVDLEVSPRYPVRTDQDAQREGLALRLDLPQLGRRRAVLRRIP